MSKKKKKVGPEPRDEEPAKKRTPMDRAEELKRKFEKDGVAGVMESLAPLLQNLQAMASEAGNAAATAGANAVGRAKDALSGTACADCGTRLPPAAKFCLECGTAVPKEKRCTKCGTSLTASVKFCPECGAKS